MLKKVVFAAVLALGFVTSFKVGATADSAGQGVQGCPRSEPECPQEHCTLWNPC